MTTTQPTAPYETFTVRVSRSGKDFGKALAKAKRYDGVYDSETKTWTIRLWADQLDTAANMGGVAEYLRYDGLALVEA